jgi:hypothetical protein
MGFTFFPLVLLCYANSLKMELDGKIMTLDLQLHMRALRVTLRSLARHSPNGSPEWQLREWNSLKWP